jgi:hypothetical protein
VALTVVYKKKILDDKWNMFASWQVLTVKDLSPAGGLNYNVIKVLRKVEDQGNYQRDILPSQASIQKSSYKLYEVRQELIPFHCKESILG